MVAFVFRLQRKSKLFVYSLAFGLPRRINAVFNLGVGLGPRQSHVVESQYKSHAVSPADCDGA